MTQKISSLLFSSSLILSTFPCFSLTLSLGVSSEHHVFAVWYLNVVLIRKRTMLILSGRPPRILISVCRVQMSHPWVFFFFFFSLRLHKEVEALIIMLQCQLSDYWLFLRGKKKSIASLTWIVFEHCLECKHRKCCSSWFFSCLVIRPYQPNSGLHHRFPCTIHSVQRRSPTKALCGNLWKNEWVRPLSHETHCKY